MWEKWSNLIYPLTSHVSKKVKFKWTDAEHKVYDEIKCIVARHTLLAYPDFNKHFDIHMDAIDYHLVSVISQEGKPVTFCSHKLTGPQTRYKVM